VGWKGTRVQYCDLEGNVRTTTLVAYKKKHNDTRTPQRCVEDPKLGVWVNNQRATYKKKKMTEERKHLLNIIGFMWAMLPQRAASNSYGMEANSNGMERHQSSQVPYNFNFWHA